MEGGEEEEGKVVTGFLVLSSGGACTGFGFYFY